MSIDQITAHPSGASDPDLELLQIFDNANLGIFRVSTDGHHIRTNAQLLEFLGCQSEKDLRDFIKHPELLSQWYMDPQQFYTFVSLLKEQGYVRHFETEVRPRGTAAPIWISKNVWPVKNQQGEILYYEGTLEDITQHKQYQLFQEIMLEFIDEALQHGLDEGFYQRLLTQTVKAVPGAQAGSILIQDSEGLLRYVAAVGFDLAKLQQISITSSELHFHLSSKQPQVINHDQKSHHQNPWWQEIINIQETIKSTLCISIGKKQHKAFLFLDNFEHYNAFSLAAQHIAGAFSQQVAALLDRLNMEQDLKERKRALETWSIFHKEIGKIVSDMLQNGLDETFYARLLQQAAGVIPNVDAGSILILKHDQRYHYVAALNYDLEKLQAVTFATHELFSGTSSEPILIQNLAQRNVQTLDTERHEMIMGLEATRHIKNTLAIPVGIDDTIVASLCLDSFKENAFNQDALDMAKTFASQIGILLQRLKLEQSIHTRQQLLEHWSNFNTHLIEFTNETLQQGMDKEFYKQLLERTLKIIPGAEAGTLTVKQPDGHFEFVAAVGFDLSTLQQVRFSPEESEQLGYAGIRKRQNRIIFDPARQETIERAEGRSVQASLTIPIHLDHEVIAYISLNSFTNQHSFDEHALRMMHTISKQVSSLLKRLQLEEQLRSRQTELEHWVSFRSNLFNFISETLQHGLDESFYQRLLEHATSVIPGVNAGSIIVRKQDGLYYYVAALGYDLRVLQQISYSEQEIISNASLDPLIINDLQNLNDQTLDPEKRTVLYSSGPIDKIKAMMSLPAIVEGQIVANLSLDTFSAEGFSVQAQEMARAFATQIGVVLKRLTLERQLEQSNNKLTRLANYDSLTGLPNRLLFANRLEQSFAQARRTGDQVGLLYMDLDGFKDVNDSLGHNMGDALLKAVGARLSKSLREEDTIARLGGDEFAVILSSLTHAQDAAIIAQKILDCLGASFDVHGYEIHIGASIGISLYPENGQTVEDMLKHADTAMYRAKRSGKNRFHFFTPELNNQILEQLKLEADLRRGLERNEFYLHYQPRIHLQTKRVDSVEALLRWKHPTQGFVSPVTFIPLAEKTGFIMPLTYYVLEQACIQANIWKSQGKHLRVAVNLSAKCLQHADLIPMLKEILETHKVEARYIELEITESAAMDDVESNIKTLNELRNLGIYIAVDDFGTAYSSLNYLKKLPVSCLKIDRSFVKDISLAVEDSADIAIVKAIVALGKALGFELVAEGVETLEQATFLQSLGCDEAQGYYFCKPLPPEELFKDASSQATPA